VKPNLHIRVGSVYWLEKCKPIDGGKPKDRPVVVVIVPPDPKDPASLAIVVAVSTSANELMDKDIVHLPDKSTQPQCTSGLEKPCAAIPRWYLPVPGEKLTAENYSGHISGKKLQTLLHAAQTRISTDHVEPAHTHPLC